MSALPRLFFRVPIKWLILALAAVLVAAAAGIAIAWPPSSREAEAKPEDCAQTVLETTEQAAALATRCGVDVEVGGARTPWERSWATADGQTRLEVSAQPAATNVSGEWGAIDNTISSSADDAGMLPVTAPVYHAGFNPGGAAGLGLPLGEMTRDGATLRLWFPLDLPVPSITGSVATYELFDGATLRVYVNSAGSAFAPIVELNSADAASEFRDRLADARVAKGLPGSGYEIPFRLTTSSDLRVDVKRAGAVELLNSDGQIEFTIPPSLMWDAGAGEPRDGEQARAVPTNPGEVPPPAARGADPWPGDAVVTMPMRYEDEALVISPDEHLLTSEATAWPVRIDPTISAQTAAEWTMLRSGGFSSSVYKFGDISASFPGGGLGLCNESACNATYKSRLVWEFGGMAGLKAARGADVTSATMRVRGVHSYNCTAQRADLYRTSLISSSSTFANVDYIAMVGSLTVAHRESCNNVRYVEYNALEAAKTFAEDDLSALALGLKANSETTMAGWKRYANNATVTIKYNRPPNTPSFTTVESKCSSTAGSVFLNKSRPLLVAKGSDPDGGTVKIQFAVYDQATGSVVWQSPYSASVAANVEAKATVDAGKLVDGKQYYVRARASDPDGKTSAFGVTCRFTADFGIPPAPTVTPLTTGAAVYRTGYEAGGVEIEGKFSISTTSAWKDRIASYAVSGGGVNKTLTGGGPHTISFVPQSAGPQDIVVRAVTRSGNSATTKYRVDVAGAREGAIWMFDEGSGTAAADSAETGDPRNLTLSGVEGAWPNGPLAQFGARSTDKALALNGTNSSATYLGAPVDTKRAFAMSAYVWLNDFETTPRTSTALSQGGVVMPAFELGYRTDGCPTTGGTTPGCWAFSMRQADSATAAETVVRSSKPVKTNQWVHIVADRNTEGTRARLWVCDIGTPTAPTLGDPGAPTQATMSAIDWRGDGAFSIGRSRESTADKNWWNGQIDNVRLFPGQVLSEAKVRRMCSGAEASAFPGDPDALDLTVAEDGE